MPRVYFDRQNRPIDGDCLFKSYLTTKDSLPDWTLGVRLSTVQDTRRYSNHPLPIQSTQVRLPTTVVLHEYYYPPCYNSCYQRCVFQCRKSEGLKIKLRHFLISFNRMQLASYVQLLDAPNLGPLSSSCIQNRPSL
jgi:hypothetical protein